MLFGIDWNIGGKYVVMCIVELCYIVKCDNCMKNKYKLIS